MSARHLCLVFGVLMTGFTGQPAPGDLTSQKKNVRVREKRPLTDRYGDPLPPGAVARLGTARFCYPGPIDHLVFSPDGKTLVVGSGSRSETPPQLWDAATGKELRRFEGHGDTFDSLVFSPHGKHLIGTNGDAPLCVWNVASGKKVPCPVRGGPGDTSAFALSADGRTWALAGGKGGKTILLWDMAWRKRLRTIQSPEVVKKLALSPNGKILATGDDGKIPATSADIFKRRPIHLWDVTTGKIRHQLGGKKLVVEFLAFSPNGRTLLSAGDNNAHLWDAATGRELHQLREAGDYAAFSPDSKWLASGGPWNWCPLRLWEVSTGRELHCWEEAEEVRCVAFAPDGKTLAWAGRDRRVRFCAIKAGGKVPRLEGHQGEVITVAFSPDGRQLASAGGDRTVRLWKVPGGKLLRTLTGHRAAVTRIAFAPDGKTLAAADAAAVRLWEMVTGKQICSITFRNQGIMALAFFPSGKVLFAATERGTARLWDVSRGKEHPDLPAGLRENKPGLFDRPFVVTSPEGKVLAVGRSRSIRNALVCLWRLPSGKPLATIEPDGPDNQPHKWSFEGGEAFEGLAFSSDSRTPGGEPEPLAQFKRAPVRQ
jgi:WD40 repeat protein